MAAKLCGEVSLQDGHVLKLPRTCVLTNGLMTQLVTKSVSAINRAVLPRLGIDPVTRQLKGNILINKDGQEPSVHDANWMNKALAMELLGSGLFACLNSPTEVMTFCSVDTNGLPCSFAAAGEDDIRVIYPEFRAVVEVCSKIRLSPSDFRRQLTQTVDHAARLAADGVAGPVYGITINEVSIETNLAMRGIYRSISEYAATKPVDVRLIHINDIDFVEVFNTLCWGKGRKNPGLDFSSGTFELALAHIFDLLSPGNDEKLKKGATRQGLLDGLAISPGPLISQFGLNP